MTTLRHTIMPTAIGPLLLVADDADRIRGVYTEGHKGGPSTPPGVEDRSGVLARARDQLGEYFAGERLAFDLPTHAVGSTLQVRVWDALVGVPYGTTTTYGRLATQLGLPRGAARAVGSANGRNPLSILVPCHRVVGASGALTGYAGGLGTKRSLLDLEARVAGAALAL
ncbi:MAG: cysteine methyltransferase [Solirubrobacterales bacterium]|nr:cysteine methyltransferase [Solirubrobacterales bacterium]